MKAIKLTFILLLSFTEIYAQNYWALTSGPNGSEVTCLYRTTSGRIFCGTYDGGVYYSNNNGINWSNVPSIPNSATSFCQTQAGYLFAGSSAIYRSSDNGVNWITVANNTSVNSLLGKIQGIIFAGNSPFGVYKSTNNGINWTISSSGIDNQGVRTLEAAPNGYIFAGGNGSGKIYRSIDSGATWQVVHTTGQNDMVYKILALAGENRIFACIGWKGIYQSTDIGATWTYFSLNNSEVIDLEIDSSSFYAVTQYRYFYSPNGGISWLEKDPNLGWNNYIKDILVVGPKIFIGSVTGINDGIYKFWVDSSNYSYLSSDLTNSRISLMHSSVSGNIFACTQKGKIFRSTDNGTTWELKYNNYSFPSNFSMCSDSLGNLYVGSNNGYLFSSNGGNNWAWYANIFYNKRVYGIVSPLQGRLIAGTDYGIYVSSNSGVNWVNTWNQSIISLAKGPDNKIYAGKYSPPGVYISTNLGNNWTEITGSGFNRLNSISVSPNNTLFAGTFMGIFASFDFGQSWANVFLYTDIKGFAINSLNQVYAFSDYHGIYFSQNLSSWNQLNSGLIANNILSMTISASGYVFAGSSGRGVYKSNYITSAETGNEMPVKFTVSQNYPNPFNPQTSIKFALPPSPSGEGSGVRLVVYDILGRQITTLVNEKLSPGTYEVTWDASNYPSGVYFYKIFAGDYIESKRMILLK